MAADNKLELVIEIDAEKANASVKALNRGLSSIETTVASASKGASSGLDKLTASLIEGVTAGTLLADAIKEGLRYLKELTIESIKAAAHEDRLAAAGVGLAKANGIAAGAFDKAVRSIQELGFSGEAAIHMIDRLIIADIDLSKATALAKIARDAAAIENIEPAQALEKILQAIEFGQSRSLRTAGIAVNFERDLQMAELQLGRTLSENEKVQLRYNAVVKAAASINGAYAASADEAEQMTKDLGTQFHELRVALGREFQDDYKQFLKFLTDAATWLKDNTWIFRGFADAIKAIVTNIALTPVGAWWLKQKQQLDQFNASLDETAKRARVFAALRQGQTLDQLKAGELKGMSDQQIRDSLTGSQNKIGEQSIPETASRPRASGPTEDQLRLALEIRKRQAEALKSSTESLLSAEGEMLKGPAKFALQNYSSARG